MANPFLRGGPANMSRRKNVEDRERPTGAIEPVPEGVTGPVFAYRGQQQHGVSTDRSAIGADPDEFLEASRYDIDYAEPVDEVEPIPVRIVQRESRELKRWRAIRSVANGNGSNPSCLIGREPLRKKITIKNFGVDWVYIGHDGASASALNGYPLVANEVTTIETTEPIYAQSSSSEAMAVVMWIEYVAGVDD